MSRFLSVYFNNDPAGTLEQDTSGRLSFSYLPSYLSSSHPIPFSVSMPLSDKVYEDGAVRPFFSNLLPDDMARHRLAQYLGVSEKNPFGLLEIIGGDCAGALSLYHEGKEPASSNEQSCLPLKEEELARLLKLLSERPLLVGEKDIRISLAGVQNKLAVVLTEDQIALPAGGRATTHIIKTPIEGISESVFNEYFCLQLARQLKLAVPAAEVRWAEGLPYLLLERYDRDPDHPLRLHQEDFCQALSIPPELKYEVEGGPSLKKCLALLEAHSLYPGVDTLTFLRLVIFNYCIGNADAHGKNFSFLYKQDQPQLAPAYDLLSTAVYSQLSPRMAMKIANKDHPEHVYLRHWYTLVPDTHLAKKMMEKELKKMAERFPLKSAELVNELNSTPLKSPIYAQIHSIIEKRCRQIQKYFV